MRLLLITALILSTMAVYLIGQTARDRQILKKDFVPEGIYQIYFVVGVYDTLEQKEIGQLMRMFENRNLQKAETNNVRLERFPLGLLRVTKITKKDTL